MFAVMDAIKTVNVGVQKGELFKHPTNTNMLLTSSFFIISSTDPVNSQLSPRRDLRPVHQRPDANPFHPPAQSLVHLAVDLHHPGTPATADHQAA